MGTGPEEAEALSPEAPSPLPSYKWPGYHRYESIQSIQPEHQAEPPAEPSPSYTFAMASGPAFEHVPMPWRPMYLRGFVWVIFAVVFALVIVAIEVLLVVSNKHNGIASSDPGRHYLWTYGPTAFLTLVAAAWGRTEYQSKLVTPWTRLAQPNVDSSRSLILDYISDFHAVAVVKSLRNRDFVVAITSGISMMIKVLIVISTGLITLSWTQVSHGSHPMVIQDSFVDSNARLTKTSALAWYVMNGLAGRNLTLPDGMSPEYAFQTVETNLPSTAETHITVDGLKSWLTCQPVDITVTGASPPDPHVTTSTMNITVASDECNVSNLRVKSVGFYGYGNTSTSLFARFSETQCDGTTGDTGLRILVIFGSLTYATDYSKNITNYAGITTNPILGTLDNSTQILCTPDYTISRVDAVRNGTQTISITPSSGTSNRTLDSVSAWDIMAAHFDSFSNDIEEEGAVYAKDIQVGSDIIDGDDAMRMALLTQLAPDADATVLYDRDTLQDVSNSYYQQYSAVIAKQMLMDPAVINATGSAIINENRLVVRNWAAQWMVGLVATCLILTLVALFIVPRQGILPHNPSTLTGLASLVLHSPDLLSRLRYAGAADEQYIATSLQAGSFQSGVVKDLASGQMQFSIVDTQKGPNGAHHSTQVRAKLIHPSALHPASRLVLCLVLVALIITLELLLRRSNRENGLGDVGNDDQIHYTWTTLPALFFGTLTMIIASMDLKIRSLMPYANIRETVTSDAIMKLDMLDMSLPRFLWREIKLYNLEALAMSTAVVIASLFTIFSGSLFQALSVPVTAPITLRVNQSFDHTPYTADNAGELASLILESNLSYPQFTYANLAFPQYVPATLPPANSNFNLSTISIQTVVPALRPKLTCRQYDDSMIRTNITVGYTIKYGDQNPLGLNIEGEDCGLQPKDEELRYNVLLATYENATYFGNGQDTDGGTSLQGCSDLLYAWGKIDYAADPIVQHVSAVGCNLTYEVVDVNTTFIGTDLAIDTSNPPQPYEDTARNSTIQTKIGDMNAVSSIYFALADMSSDPQLLDSFFSMLVSSPWAVPISALGDKTQNNAISAAIQFQHSIIQVQNLAQFLVPANTSNSTLTNPNPGDNDAQTTYTGTATDPIDRRRVVQDAASTRVLESLVGVALLLLIASWILMPRTDVLPRRPTTIASVVALIAGGNLLEFLPPDAEWRSPDDIARALGPGTRIWMGWGNVPDVDGKALGGENEGGASRFGIFALRADQQTTAYQGQGGPMGEAHEDWQSRALIGGETGYGK